ncbi:MAG: hypothetical protein IID53_10605 [Proteobacteria bacterium]|nr:hypothetical protein [Pseudomonadota bacterium]
MENFISDQRKSSRQSIRQWQSVPLAQVLDVAGLGNDFDGKRHDHLKRLKAAALRSGQAELRKKKTDLKSVESFDQVYQLTKEIADEVKWLGPMWTYDTAVAIGSHLRRMPRRVYLHRGARDGAKRLLGRKVTQSSLLPSAFPRELSKLKAYEIEDFLCICKDDF